MVWPAVLVAGVTIGLAAAAQDKPAGDAAPTFVSPADVKWADGPPTLPAGTKVAVLEGNPKEPAPFTMRLKLPADAKLPPHFHPADERVKCISGEFNAGLGDAFDPAKAKKLPAGSFMMIPKGTHHFAFVKEETVVQLNGIGPWKLTYVNPADDPSNKK
jgi:quercetin dioxygenase-like cupin family protein